MTVLVSAIEEIEETAMCVVECPSITITCKGVH